jgi:ribosomal protein S18 acetylase RimI-like enzyme
LKVCVQDAALDDAESLWTFLAMAAQEPNVEIARTTPLVASHLVGWPRAGDFGVTARHQGVLIGAAWARQFAPHEPSGYYVDDQTAELAMGVSAEYRGQGVGRQLLGRLIQEARKRHVGLCLSVREDNAAVRLYESVGFRKVPGSRCANRVGGYSWGMVLPMVAHQKGQSSHDRLGQ